MDIIKVGRKEFEILEKLGENSFKVQRKGNFYFLRQFPNDYAGFLAFCNNIKHLDNTGVKHPKIRYKDKKNYITVQDYIKGDNVFDLLLKSDLSEKIIEKMFLMSYFAKLDHHLIDFDPINYKYDGDELYYLSTHFEPYKEDHNFAMYGIKYWLYTKDFKALAMERGYDVDLKRLKPDYELNKQMVLLTCKYYR